MKTITVNEMMKENEKFFYKIIRVVRNGGTFVCNNTMNEFRIINKKFVPLTKRGYVWIKGITTTEWSKSNVVPYVNPQMN